MSTAAERLARVELLWGPEAIEKLQNSCVAVAGMGAVGSFAIESLARSGIGHFILADFDDINVTNINRQLYATTETIGQPKVELAKARILSINPDAIVDDKSLFLDDDGIKVFLDKRPDYLVDAIDSVNSKAALLAAAHQDGIPCISSMGAATRQDPSKIKVGDLFKTHNCPLAKFMRKRLRKRGIHTGIRCVYSTEERNLGALADELEKPEDRSIQRGRPRQPMGSFCSITGIFGLYAASEVIQGLLSDG